MKEKQYIPFGEEWKKEMNKWTKKDLIEFLRKTLMRNRQFENVISELKLKAFEL